MGFSNFPFCFRVKSRKLLNLMSSSSLIWFSFFVPLLYWDSVLWEIMQFIAFYQAYLLKWLIYLKGSGKGVGEEKGEETRVFDSLVHSPNGPDSWSWGQAELGGFNSTWVPRWVAGAWCPRCLDSLTLLSSEHSRLQVLLKWDRGIADDNTVPQCCPPNPFYKKKQWEALQLW